MIRSGPSVRDKLAAAIAAAGKVRQAAAQAAQEAHQAAQKQQEPPA